MTISMRTGRLVLRDFVEEDAVALFELYRLPETSEFESWEPHSDIGDSEELTSYWVEQQKEVPRTDFTLAIEYNGGFVGLCGMTLGFGTETDDQRVGFLGYRIHPDYWGLGLATEASASLLNFSFSSLGLHRVHSGCCVNNAASIRVLEKLTFRREGISHKSFPIGENWFDYAHYGLLKDEYMN